MHNACKLCITADVHTTAVCTELRIQLLYLQLLYVEYVHMLLCRPCHWLHLHLPLRWRVHELVHLWHPHPHGERTK